MYKAIQHTNTRIMYRTTQCAKRSYFTPNPPLTHHGSATEKSRQKVTCALECSGATSVTVVTVVKVVCLWQLWLQAGWSCQYTARYPVPVVPCIRYILIILNQLYPVSITPYICYTLYPVYHDNLVSGIFLTRYLPLAWVVTGRGQTACCQ
jgi:hypothetical protein